MENILEAKECYILMKKEYRISRNIRAEWYLNRINSYVTVSRKTNVNEFTGELNVVSVVPLNPPPEWDSDTSHEYKYLITEKTQLHFLSQKYRLVLCLDLSPSLSVVNIEQGKIVFDEIFPSLEKCLRGVVQPYFVPGHQLMLFPKIYITIIAHTPFFKSQPQQVIVQGWLLVNNSDDLELFLKGVHLRLIELQNQLTKLTKEAYSQAENAEANHDVRTDHFTSSEDGEYPPYSETHSMVSPDIGFVNMLRYGIVALQLLPQNSMAGIIVITDGVISLPDATMFDALLVQLRNLTISCSFLQIGTIYQPHTGLGYIPFNDLMLFLANTTFGVYLTEMPEINPGYLNQMNDYHKAFLTWSFQKGLEERMIKSISHIQKRYVSRISLASECAMRIRKQEKKGLLKATLNAVLSCRLREGYTIKDVKIAADRIELTLVLAWKYSISIGYYINSLWPPTQSEVQTEVWIEASYEFLNDVSNSEANCGLRSHYRRRMVAKYLSTLQDLRETDLLLEKLQSFPSNPNYFTIPDCAQKGIPVFYLNSQSNSPVPASDFQVQYPQFANFWLPICMLNINKWQKWMHTHRIGVILKHETPLPKNLHLPNASGRYGTVHSRPAEQTLTSYLASWTDFTLIENNSYIKYLYNSSEEDQTPSSFFVVRITSNRPPCLAIRLAFLGGTSCLIRDKIVGELQKNIQMLTVRIRERSRERKTLDGAQKLNHEERDRNVALCCSITHKPIEKILIWHDRIPPNLFSSQIQDTSSRFPPHPFSARLGATNKSASDNQALLCRYLHHRRWIWGLQSPLMPPITLNAITRILDTLTRMRLEEGFKFAYSRDGIVTMIKEFEMKLDLRSSIIASNRLVEPVDTTSHCTVQYIMFPPHFANLRDNLEEEGDEMESVEADGESQLMTECWVEPQNGVVRASPSPTSRTGLNYKQLAASFFECDRECIWGLILFESLVQFCLDENCLAFASAPAPAPPPPTGSPLGPPNPEPIQQIPFAFHLAHLLPRCQMAEVRLSTLFQDFFDYFSNPGSPVSDCDRANSILYTLILDHLNRLHEGKQFLLSSEDSLDLPSVLAQRLRDPQHGASVFANTRMANLPRVPLWRCFLKYVTPSHFLITLVPSSYADLRLLLTNRRSVAQGESGGVRLFCEADDLSPFDMFGVEEEEERKEGDEDEEEEKDEKEEKKKQKGEGEGEAGNEHLREKGGKEEEEEGMEREEEEGRMRMASFSSLLTASDGTLHDHACSPSPSQPLHHSFTSTSSNLSNWSSGLPQEGAEKGPAPKQLFPVNDPGAKSVPEETGRRTRYRSGPALSNQKLCPIESLELLDIFGPRRGRAYSLHSNTDSGPPKRPLRGSLTLSSKDEKAPSLKADPWAAAGAEKQRKRNVSMPSKCQKEMLPTKTIYHKSLSVDLMKEDPQHPTTLFPGPENEPATEQPTHKPLYGTVTLPIYCFDCKLSSIINQFVNKDRKSTELGRDIHMDSTFKMEGDLHSSHHQSTSGTSHEAADKFPSPEPLSEESDILVSAAAASDSKCLRTFTESIEKCQRRSFVMGVFEALSNGLFVHAFDVQAAVDQCQEVPLDTDITTYLEVICGHLNHFNMRFYMKEKRNFSMMYTLGRMMEPKADATPVPRPFPLSILSEHVACQDLLSIQSSIRRKFADILQRHFKAVPDFPDYYFYSPKSASYSQAENIKYKSWSVKRNSKKKSGGESYTEEEQMEGDPAHEEDRPTEEDDPPREEEDEDGFLESEEREKSIEFRSEDGSYAGRQRYLSQLSQLSHLSGYDDGRGSEGNDSDCGVFPPLFLHLICTVRCGTQTIGTTSLSTLPTCLGDIANCFDVPCIDVSRLSITLDVLVMTLLGGADICNGALPQTPVLRGRGRRTISGCSTFSSNPRDSESTVNSTSESEDVYVDEEELLLHHLPDDQHKAVIVTFENIKWLIQDEIVSALLHCFPITEEMLQLVATHVSDSHPTSNCCKESVPLKFVFGMEQSMDKFMQEFLTMKVSSYQLEKIGHFYFLGVPPDCYRKRRLFSLLPPLAIKSPSLELGRKPSEDLSEVMESMKEDHPEKMAGAESASSPQDESLLRKAQKVSFETNPGESKVDQFVLEAKRGEEVKKGEKWIRRRERKERRDSEKRGRLESSDSDEEALNSGQTPRDLLNTNNEKKAEEGEEGRKEGEGEVKKDVPGEDEVEKKDAEQKFPPPPGAKAKEGAASPESSRDPEAKIPSPKWILGDPKETPDPPAMGAAEILSPLIRCGSINLPHTQSTNKTEVIRKSASTDDFSPSLQDAEGCKGTVASNTLLSEMMRTRHSFEGLKFHQDYSKSRHSSGGDLLKSRHNSGTGSVIWPFSDVSSLVGSEQTTEDGCEGDISDSDEGTDWMHDMEVPQPSHFWVVIRIEKELVQTYFHCRHEIDVYRWKSVHEEVVRSLKERVRLVNQCLLLQDLNNCRMCNHLLEPETSEDIWKHEDAKDPDAESSEYLEAAMKFKLGAFACRQVWSKRFELHPRLKLSGKGGIKGIHTLKKTLNPFMVNNRKNMFVYEDSSGVGTNVFYLRLHEQQSLSAGGNLLENRRDESLSRSSSIVSLGKRGGGGGGADEALLLQGESRRCFVEKDVIVEGVPSTLGHRRSQDFIVLSVHGIAEPGVAIKENLVQMLQKRLDDAVLDAICLMLWDNPHHKLTAEDVHFIQPPYQPPSRVIRFSVNAFALSFIPAICYYLRQNMLCCGFTPPKYTDSRPENHFQDFSATDQDPTTEANIFLFVCSQKSGTKGVACLAFSVVDSAGNAMQPRGPHRLFAKQFQDLLPKSDFGAMTQTVLQQQQQQQQPPSETDGASQAMFQFKVWESGRLDFDETTRCLEESIRHALWDLSMECRFLVAPITPSCASPSGGSSQPSTPVKGGGRLFGSPKSSLPSHERAGSPLSYNQVEMVTKAPSRSPSKARHSVDLGKDYVLPRIECSLAQESITDEAQSPSPESPPETLNPVFARLMTDWLEYGVQMNVPSLKKHVALCPTRSALPVFMHELQRWLHFHLSDSSTKFFIRSPDGTYNMVDNIKVCQLLANRRCPGAEDAYDVIVTNRSERHWWSLLFEKDLLEINNHVVRAQKSMKFGPLFVLQSGSSSDTLSELHPNSNNNSGYVSSPTAMQALSFSDAGPPVSQSQPHFKFGEAPASSHSAFIHRQIFFFATLVRDELTVYSYNWMKDLSEMLHTFLNRLCQWTTGRTCLLSSLALQKLGLFHNQPFVRKEGERKDLSKKEESNPFVQNLYYIEGLIKSTSPGRDSMGPSERSGRRNQTQPSLQNLSEVLRDSAPPSPLSRMAPKKDLLQRHGMQMAEVTRTTIQRERERRILQSTMQSQAATTPVFNDVTLALFKKHARIVHFCLTPLLFLPRWRSEVATMRDHSLPDFTLASTFDAMTGFTQAKGHELRSRHESGASVKGGAVASHLELKRSSSVGLPPSALPSPNQNRKRHPTLGGEDKWHDALCLSYLKEFIQYLHCLGFVTLCVPHPQPNYDAKSGRASGPQRKERVGSEPKMADQDISVPTYLVRHFFGGTVLLQINFAEPYFSIMFYILEASRTQYRIFRSKSQSLGFIDEVELIRVLLHVHSFTFDYHLRSICVYVADRQLLFTHGYHLSSFLSDFIKYYHKSPNFARNLIHSGEVCIKNTGTPGEQLYNYLLAREKEYQMRVLRMTPVVVDFSSDRHTEFVLVHTEAYRFPFDEECEPRDGNNYDVTLLVSHDTAADLNANNTLSLKFYVILTSRRDMYPNRDAESKTGRFRTVSMADSADQQKSATTGERISSAASLAGAFGSTNSFSSNASTSNLKGQGHPIPHPKGPSPSSKASNKPTHVSIRHESVNYLGYYSGYEMHMQQILQQQVAEARERILRIFNIAKIHCRRDSLWQRLIWGFKEDERLRASKDQSTNNLTFVEFTELLTLVSVKSISSLDPYLLPLVSKPIHWYQGLARLLSVKYQDPSSYGTRTLTSSDGNTQHVVVYSLGCPDACMMISHNLHTQRADISCVRKNLEGEETLEPKVRSFLHDFINGCSFHLWSGLI